MNCLHKEYEEAAERTRIKWTRLERDNLPPKLQLKTFHYKGKDQEFIKNRYAQNINNLNELEARRLKMNIT